MSKSNHQQFTLKRVFLSKFHANVFRKKISNNMHSFPKLIEDYLFQKTILRQRTDRPFQFALYVNKDGKKAIAKKWEGKHKDFDYYSLINEIKVYEKLKKLYKSRGHEIAEKYPDIKIPELIAILKGRETIILVVEYIDYGTIGNFDTRKKIIIYEHVIKYLHFIGKFITRGNDNSIAKRTLKNAILIAPFLSIKVIIKYPKFGLDILKALAILIGITPFLVKETEVTFLHKSLEDHNILSDGKNISLIDFELSVIGHPIYELAQLMLLSWRNPTFKESFYKSTIMKNILKDNKLFFIYKALSIYSGLVELAFGNRDQFINTYTFLKHAVSLKRDTTNVALNEIYSTIKDVHKKTLSVGIPVYNEAENIQFLLRTIVKQRQNTYRLEKIIVVCDGSTDGTDRLVNDLKDDSPIIDVFTHKNRKGKKSRLMEIYQKNKSDFLMTLDGDIALSDANVFEHMLCHFDKKDIAIVGGNFQPIKAENFLQSLMNTWESYWYYVRYQANGGDTVHNCSGCAMALRRDFAKTINFPKEIIRDAPYIYFKALAKKLHFRFANDAVILYRKPNNIKDYLIQSSRYEDENQKLAMIFGNLVNQQFKISTRYKLAALGLMLLTSPIYTVLSWFFVVISIFLANRLKNNSINAEKWEIASSTKKSLNINF